MEADIKIVIVDRVQSGQLQKKIDEMLKIPKSTVIYICRKFSDAGFFGKTIERQYAVLNAIPVTILRNTAFIQLIKYKRMGKLTYRPVK